MPKRAQLEGKRFGSLIVEEWVSEKSKWLCKCDCGGSSVVSTRDLNSGNSTTCGTMHKHNMLIGEKIGKLTVIKIHGKDKSNGTFLYYCECDCGGYSLSRGSDLRGGRVRSCSSNRCELREIMKTDEYKQKISVANGGENNGMYGIIQEQHPNWDPKRTREQRIKERKTHEDRRWRLSVFERDTFTCQTCGDNKGGNLVAHHLDSYNWCEDKRYSTENGITLCECCHKDFHSLYGYGNNTKEQFNNYIKDIQASF